MKRLPVALRASACALALSPLALAAPAAHAATTKHHPTKKHHAVKAKRAHRASTAVATGTVTASGGSWFTIQTSGRRLGVVNAMTATANVITRGHYWYVWGGGHAMAGVPTRSRKTVGFDCSGSVTAVLAGAGLWPAGAGVPNDAGVIAQLLHDGLIARGAGTGATEVTLYDEPGIHIFMNIDGRFFGTSDGAGGTGPHSGAGWLYDGAYDAHNPHFKQYHVLPSVLRDSTSYGHTITFQAGTSAVAGVATGDRVQVTYADAGSGELVASAVTYPGAKTLTGTVATVGAGSFTLAGSSTTYTIAPTLVAPALSVGDQVQLSYTQSQGQTLVRTLTVTAAPAVTEATGTVTSVAGDGSSLTIQATDGSTLTLSTGGNAQLVSGATTGDTVAVSYLNLAGTLVLQQVSVTAQPNPAGVDPTTTVSDPSAGTGPASPTNGG